MPEISVILPVYNVGKYLSKCIHSVLQQSFPDFELLIIDDESTDDSREVAQSFSDPRIKLFFEKHRGLSGARNTGLNYAKGNFIYFIDSDDWIERDLIEKNLKLLRDENLDFVVFGYFREIFSASGKIVLSEPVVPRKINVKEGERNFYLDGDHLDILGYAWNKLYRASFLKKFSPRFEEGTTLIEDILFNCQVFSNSRSIRFNREAYYHYANRPDKSLIKIFYPNSFDLMKRKKKAIGEWLNRWKIDPANQLPDYALITGIRYCLYNLFGCTNNLTYIQKMNYVRMMLEDVETGISVQNFVPDSQDLLVFKSLVENRMIREICERELRKYPGVQSFKSPGLTPASRKDRLKL